MNKRNNYNNLCEHLNQIRISDDVVKCTACGRSMIDQVRQISNKKPSDFIKENKVAIKNFDRNFSNEFEDPNKNLPPDYIYYTDKHGANIVVINKNSAFKSDPPKYETMINGTRNYLTNEGIVQILKKIRAHQIADPSTIK